MSSLAVVKKEEPLEEEEELVSHIDVVETDVVKHEVKDYGFVLRDPLTALSAETVLHIVSFLSPNDLVTVGQLNTAWRQLTRRPEVWRRVFLNLNGIRSQDPKLYRVLRAAPLIGRVAMRLVVSQPVRDALLACTTQVTEIFAAEMVLEESPIVETLLRRWAGSLEIVELDGPSFGTMKTLATLAMPRLREIIVRDVLDGSYEDRDLGISQKRLLRAKGPLVSFDDGVPDKNRLASVHCSSENKVSLCVSLSLIRAHRETLQELLLDWSLCRDKLSATRVMETVASCSQLRRAALDCSHKLRLLAGLDQLESLHVWLSQHTHTDQGGGHARCIRIINELPVTIKHLMLTVYNGDDGPVLQELLRVAPLRLQCLSTLVLVWRKEESAKAARAALAPLLPRVWFRSVDQDEECRHREAWAKKYGFVHFVLTHGNALRDITQAPFLSILNCPQML